MPGAAAQVIGVKQEGGFYTATSGQSFQSSRNRGLSMTPENVSTQFSAHNSVKLFRAVHPRSYHKLIRRLTSKKKTIRKVHMSIGNHGNIDTSRLRSRHVSCSLNGRKSVVPCAGRHNSAGQLQCDPLSGLKDRGALDQERHVSDVSSVQGRSLSSLPDSTTSQEWGKHSVRQNKAKIGLKRQTWASDQRGKNAISGTPPYSEGDSSQSLIRERMRYCMRRVPQSVAIITATDRHDSQQARRGATVSSFTTVTFEPEVVVSVNLKLPSTTYDAILSSNCFDIHMLKATAGGAELASRFAAAQPASHLDEARNETFAMEKGRQVRSSTFPRVLCRSQRIRNPVAFRIPCLYMPDKTVQIGDHVVIFGKVGALARKSYDLHAEKPTTCLAYIDGCYGYVEPLRAQPKRVSAELSPNKNGEAPSRIAKQSPISRKDFVAFASHAQECVDHFKKTFFSDAHFDGLQRRTLLLVRKLRFKGGEVHYAILSVSKTAKGFHTLLQYRSSLLTEIHRLLAFYFIFCGSRQLACEEPTCLPQSVQRHRKVFIFHLFEIGSYIKTIHNELDPTVFPDPHPFYALQKAPRRMDLVLPYVQNYASWFIAGQQFETARGENWCPRTYCTLVYPYLVRMRLLDIWLRHLWLSKRSEVSLSLIDSLLDMPTCYLMFVRNWLVLCAHQMILPLRLLYAAKKIRHEPFNRSLLHYNEFCISLWNRLDCMKLTSYDKTITDIMRQWKHGDTLYQSWRPDMSLDVNSAGHKIAIKTTSMRKETECAELTEKEEAGQKGHMKFEDDSAERLHESREGDHADLCILPKDGIKNLVTNPLTSINERPPVLYENDKSYMLTRTPPQNSNGPLHHKSSTMRKSKLAVSSIPRTTMPPQSILSMPFRGFSSTKVIGRNRTEPLDRRQNNDDSNICAVSKVRLLDTIAIRKHYARGGSGTVISVQQVGLRSGKKGHNRIINKDHDEISRLIKKVLIRKHLVHDNYSLPLPACHNQAHSNSSTAAEHTEDIEALIKALLYGSDIRIRKQLTTNKWDDHSYVSPPSHMSEDLDQVLRKNIESIMRETPNGQQTPVQALSEEVAFRQRKKMQKMAKRQAMERDIEDVMGQIQDYFQQRSRTAVA